LNEWEWQLLEDKTTLDSVEIQGSRLGRGDRVRLKPREGGDVFDLALTGRTASIESIEQDYEGKLHVCVVVDDDPGRDVGLLRQPGHRFFFAPAELELLTHAPDLTGPQTASKKILIAGIGNIFLGDDGFGVEVAGRLACRPFPAGVRVADFGIRGFDLAYALMEGYEFTILVDAYPGEAAAPGALSVLEISADNLDAPESAGGFVEPHAMNPINVLRMAAGLGAKLQRVYLVGCVPATLGPEEGQMGLSEPVNAALDDAVELVESLVSQIVRGDWPRTK
jgi:hydrogenase maturation protease